MKKTIKLLSLLLLANLLVTGCGKEQSQVPEEKTINTSQEKNLESGESENKQNQLMTATADIQEAIEKGQELSCTYTDTELGEEAIVIIKNDKYKSSINLDDKKFHSLSDGQAIYTWTEDEKTGMMMEISCLEELGEIEDQFSDETTEESVDYRANPNDFVADYQGNIKCEKSSGTSFEAPSDIDFQDFCQNLKNTMGQLENFSNLENMPNFPNNLQ